MAIIKNVISITKFMNPLSLGGQHFSAARLLVRPHRHLLCLNGPLGSITNGCNKCYINN